MFSYGLSFDAGAGILTYPGSVVNPDGYNTTRKGFSKLKILLDQMDNMAYFPR